LALHYAVGDVPDGFFDLQRKNMSGYLGGKDMAAAGSGNEAPAPVKPMPKPVTAPALLAMRAAGEKITMLTCYDASFAALMDRCGVEVLLIGDSLGMVCAGYDSTLPVTVADVAYHTASVVRGRKNALVLADMPFGSYPTKEAAYDNAVTLMRAGAQMVKIEGGAWLAETVRFLVERGIPVCAHIGLTPQFVHQLGGYKVQGKTDTGAAQLKSDALALQAAGASLVVLEAIPAALGKEVTERLHIPTIGQVLVMHDLLGVFPGRKARFVKNFMDGQTSIDAAIQAYVGAVKNGSFPAPEHCF
jgi:3-methyl-2-oxobutanoate hydroxymethyltransferase